MTKRSRKLLFSALIGALLFLSGVVVHAQQPLPDPSSNANSAKEKSKPDNNSTAATPNPTSQTPPSPAPKPSTAQTPTPPANGGGIVWVNTASGLYHKPGSRYYGKTKKGKYMTEADARKAGYRPAAKE